MNEIISQNPLVQKIVEDTASQDLLDMLLAKQLPLTDEEYLEALVFVVKNQALKEKALELLRNIPQSVKTNYAEKRSASPRVAYYILLEALNNHEQNTLSRIIHNQAFPVDFLLKIAEKGTAPVLEILLENQIKLIAFPQIMEIVHLNPNSSKYINGKLDEIKEYYLSADKTEDIQLEDVVDSVQELLLSEQAKVPESSHNGEEPELSLENIPLEEIEKRTLTMLQIINEMSVSEKIRMALQGSKSQRAILIRDSNKMVSQSVVESPKLSKDEVALIVRNRSVSGEIIGKIAKNKEWVKDYSIILELCGNPKTPVKDALGYIKRLHMRDLKGLTGNKNASPVIRNLAMNFYRQKTDPSRRKG